MRKTFGRLDLNGRPAIVTCYNADNYIKVLTYALKSFDLNYSANIRSKSQLKTMPWIEKIFNDPEHCQQSHFIFKIRLCRRVIVSFVVN